MKVFFALAYCTLQEEVPELRRLAYAEVATLIDNQSDFILFISYWDKLARQLRQNRASFGHGMRNLVKKWYEKHSTLELANMFGTQRGLHNWSHHDIIVKAHMRTKKPTAPTAASTQNASTAIQASSAPSTSSGRPTTALTPQDDREHVLNHAFHSGGQKYLKYLNELPRLGEGAKRLKCLQMLKINENVAEAVKIIRKNRFTVEQLPSHLLERVEVWDALLPTLTFRQIFKYFHTIRDLGLLNEDDRKQFCDKFIIHCCDFEKLHTENICPIYVFIQMRLYEKNVRYLSMTKAEHYEKKVQKRKITVNTRIQLQLEILFGQALAHAKPAPANYFVMIGLRKGNARKHVLRNKHINCFEASMALAYSLFKREKNTLLYSYTGDKDKIQALHNRFKKSGYSLAQSYCESQMVDRTFQSLAKPIQEATALKKKVDVFVVIVDSVARFCQGQVPTKEFIEYKQKFNKKAKYVVINLARNKPDLVIDEYDENDMVGFFEICGFSEDVPKMLYALGKHCFT